MSHYAWSDEEMRQMIENEHNVTIQRYKGLGEMNADQLWDTTMNPEKRALIQVKIDDLSTSDKRVSILMGDQVAPRRQWIEENVDFEISDDFDLELGVK